MADLKADKVREHDILMNDGGFTCLDKDEESRVYLDHDFLGFEGMYVNCSQGKHYLCGQLDDEGYVVGFRLKKEA